VNQKGKTRYFFAGANTANGYRSYYRSILEDMKKIYILKGAPSTGKSTIIKKIGQNLTEQGFDVDYMICVADNNPDGLLVPLLKLAIVDGSYPHVVEPRYPGAVEEVINLENCWDHDYLEKERESIIKLTEEVRAVYQKAYRYLKTAKEIHDQWEQYFLEGLNFKIADAKTEELMKEIFTPQRPPLRHLFASSIGAEGPVNFIDNITTDCKRRYILHGQPGTGKSTLIKKIAQRALDEGYYVDMYHCSLDPENIDMIVIEQLGIAVIHGTEPHRIEATKPGDVIIDMLEAVQPEIIIKYKEETKRAEEEFGLTQAQAVKSLGEARRKHKKLSDYYKKAVDFSKVDKLQENLLKKINEYISKNK